LSAILILLLLFTIPQVLWAVPEEVRLGPFGFHVFDIFTGLAIIWWLHSYFIAKKSFTSIQFKLNNIYFIFLWIGLIPIIVGAFRGKDDLLGAYRFFFYFIWLPVLVRFVQKHPRPTRIVYYLIIVNLLSCLIALYKHFTTIGFHLSYLEIHNELNLFIVLLLLALCLSKESLFGKNKINYIIFFVFLVTLLIDHSRKCYLAFVIGGMLLFLNNFKDRTRKERRVALFAAFVVAISVLVLFKQFGLSDDFKKRVKTIGVIPGITAIESVDQSIGFRLAALQVGLRVVGMHPFTGTGTGRSELLAEEIEKEKIRYGLIYHGYSPHNFYLSMLVSFGIPIVVFVCCVIFYLVKLSWNNIKKLPRENRAIAQGMFFGFIGFIIIMFFEGFEIFTILDLWLFLGLLLGFANLNQQQFHRGAKMNFSKKSQKVVL